MIIPKDEIIEQKKLAEKKILNLIRTFETITGYKVEDIIWHNNKPILDVNVRIK